MLGLARRAPLFTRSIPARFLSTRGTLLLTHLPLTSKGTVVSKAVVDCQLITKIKEQKTGRVFLAYQHALEPYDLQENCEVGDNVTFDITPNGFATDIYGSKRLQTYAQLLDSDALPTPKVVAQELDVTDDVIPPQFNPNFEEAEKQRKKTAFDHDSRHDFKFTYE